MTTKGKSMSELKAFLETDAAGRPLHELLSIAAIIVRESGDDSVADCLRYKAQEAEALASRSGESEQGEELIREQRAHEQIGDILVPLVGTVDGTSVGAAQNAREEILSLRSRLEEEKSRYTDTEADGVEFCGKCGKKK